MSIHYHHLSQHEREEISRSLAAGQSQRQISRALGRSPSTISREVRRNRKPKGYRAFSAQRSAVARTRIPRRPRRLSDPWLKRYVEEKLKLCWSPEQIARRLRLEFPDDRTKHVSHETIYAGLYLTPRGELRRVLRRGHDRRRKRTHAPGRGKIPNMVSIHDRPEEVDGRRVPGHWEGDLIKSGRTPAAIGVLVERTSRLVMMIKLESSTAADAETGFARKFRRVPAIIRKSLTYDQGKEMSNHQSLAKKVKIDIYFADPHSPWQRATCENTNGLIRQYFPKGTDFTDVTQRHLNTIANQLNGRPRKGLDWLTPMEKYDELIEGLGGEDALPG